MRSSVSLALLLLTACGGAADYPREPIAGPPPPPPPARDVPLPPEAGAAAGPSGTAGAGQATGLDEVGYASWYGEELAGNPTASGAPFDPAGVSAAHRTLPLGSYAEVTALDSGRTIIVRVNDRGPGRADRVIDLSLGAARLLEVDRNPGAPVRVRSVTPTPMDITALMAGRAAPTRLDAPPQVLNALRKQLPRATAAVAGPRKPIAPTKPKPKPASAPIEAGAFLVQVAAFSSESRARDLAKVLGGRVESIGALHRVRLGPFPDAASAQRARDGAARRGYGDATILTEP